jgi:hypothetical protein
VTLFAGRVAAIADRRQDLGDRAWLAQRRVARALDESGHEQIVKLTDQVRREATELLDGQLADRPAEEFEAAARAAVTGLIKGGVEAWRGELIDMLERELETICAQGLSELEAQLADLRTAASELLGLELAVSAVESPLRTAQRFWYSFDRGVGWELPLSEFARKVLPGRRRRARQRVLDEIRELVDRQVGRVRSDLAQRFKLSVGEVTKQLGAEHDEVLGRVQYALSEASRLSAAAGSERDERTAQLGARREALRQVLAALDTGT